MEWLRRHWFDLGGVLAAVVLVGVLARYPAMTPLQIVLWVGLATLFVHQLEEYRYPGTFPGMVNQALYRSPQPDRYPLNAQTSLVVNVGVGWTSYLLAAVLAERAVWLGVATVLVSVGNVVAHTILFPRRGGFFYNPGMLTAVVLFLPVSVAFFWNAIGGRTATPLDFVLGVPLGVVLNYLGIVKTIDWMKDPNTPYVFPPRFIPR